MTISERFDPRMVMPENLQNEQSSCSFSRDTVEIMNNSISHYEFLKHCDTNYFAEKCASDFKMKNRHKQNFEGEANNMQLDKEDTRRIN